MPGVSICVKELTRGTATDAEGIYVITAEANDSVGVFVCGI